MGLTQAHLVSQDGASAHAAQRRFGGTKLVGKRGEPEARKRDKCVEAGLAPHPHGLVDQARACLADELARFEPVNQRRKRGETVRQLFART